LINFNAAITVAVAVAATAITAADGDAAALNIISNNTYTDQT
jgi:hypothetical protein